MEEFSAELATTSNALVTPKTPQLGMRILWLGILSTKYVGKMRSPKFSDR
jgi:hypothetical protein